MEEQQGDPKTMTTIDVTGDAKKETPIKKVDDVPPTGSGNSGGNRKNFILAIGCLALVALVVVLVVALSGESEEEVVPPVSVSVDFATGVSLITYYHINATISQRLARSVVTMEVANALDCTSVHSVTLQLPPDARVAALRTIADDGCTTRGEVQALEKARETFAEQAAAGLPSAYVEARDGTTYSLQVSLPPLGTTHVELVTEELLRQKVGEVKFQLPFVPNEKVDQVSLDITILDANNVGMDGFVEVNSTGTIVSDAGPSFELDLGSHIALGTVVSPYKLDIPDAREHALPTLMRGGYKPDALPNQGVLDRDGGCFEYTFLPSLAESKSKNIFFLLDISRSDYNFLDNARVALKEAIDLLTPQDTFTIQAFDSNPTAYLWGSAFATDLEKEEAKKFLDELSIGRYSTNLHAALLEGLVRSKSDAEDDLSRGVVTLMVVLSNSWALSGATNRTKIASDVWKLNKQGHVKIFSIGSPSADHQLLNAIATTNGGVTTSVEQGTPRRGNGIYSSQISSFFESEFGNILLSDVIMTFEVEDGASIYGETPKLFPVLSGGTEVVVRGLLNHTSSARILRATTKAVSPNGQQSWFTDAVADPFVATLGETRSRCFQSYAHSRITQLMRLRDVAVLLGDGVVEPILTLTQPCDRETTSFADCIKAEAISLSLKAQVVTTGLTGLVTIDDEMCVAIKEGAEICLDGTNKGDFWESDADIYTGEDSARGNVMDSEGAPYATQSYSSGSNVPVLMALLLSTIAASFLFWDASIF